MKSNRIILVLLSFFITNYAFSQIFSTTAKYKTIVDADTLYYFSNWSDVKIKAKAQDSQATIEWYSFDSNNLTFSTLLKKTEAQTDDFTTETSNGYLCKITNNDIVTEYRFWIDVPTIDTVSFSIDTVSCDAMEVTANVKANPTKVFQISDKSWVNVEQKLVYNWYISDTLQLTLGNKQATLESPMDDTELKLVVQNQVDNNAIATDSVVAFGVKAIYSYSERERKVENEIATSGAYSAPAEIEFESNSKGNVTVYEWIMGEAARLYEKNPVYSFQNTGIYQITLIVTDETTGCSSADSTLELTITDAFLGFPNVFTPNGDGVNDEFRPAYKSLKNYDLKIYNRWGRRIYHSTNPATGWNGKEGNAEAAEGVYMYVAEADGFDKGVKIKRHGSVTLVR